MKEFKRITKKWKYAHYGSGINSGIEVTLANRYEGMSVVMSVTLVRKHPSIDVGSLSAIGG